jgi:hypothetical protein
MEEMEAKDIIRIDDSVIPDRKCLRIYGRPVRYQRLLDIIVCDSAAAIEATEFVIGQECMSTSQSFGFGDSLLEVEML